MPLHKEVLLIIIISTVNSYFNLRWNLEERNDRLEIGIIWYKN